MAAAQNASPRGQLNDGQMVLIYPNERTMLTRFLTKVQSLDPDILVGHNIGAFDLTIMLNRMQRLKVPWKIVGLLCIIHKDFSRKAPRNYIHYIRVMTLIWKRLNYLAKH